MFELVDVTKDNLMSQTSPGISARNEQTRAIDLAASIDRSRDYLKVAFWFPFAVFDLILVLVRSFDGEASLNCG